MPDSTHKIGFIVNPLAGIGGRVGLKGSDGQDTVQEAFARGAELVSPDRAQEMLAALADLSDRVDLVTYPARMGADEARQAGFSPTVLGDITPGETTAADTRQAARDMLDAGVELIVFVGGDGTARDIHAAIDQQIPVIGVPAGVKIHSSVYTINPRRAADLVAAHLDGRTTLQQREVMDIDEEAFRAGRLSAELYGYLQVPTEGSFLQGGKVASSGTDDPAPLAEYIVETMEEDVVYILGPGTTVAAIGAQLGIDKTLLGVDIVRNREQIGRDVTEADILEAVEGQRAQIVVTVIGGQGHIFGRGNQQISPAVIRAVGADNITVVALKDKLRGLKRLLVDTGAPDLDEALSGYRQVVVDYRQMVVRKVEA